jgi:2-polyprenyl-3-methyl-5-hydroxy-6-metoxy-1,4-benzoquinol methylase
MKPIPHDERFHAFKSERARQAFETSFVGLFEDVREYLKIDPAVLFALCARAPHLNAQAWKEAMKQGLGVAAAYQSHMDTYFYDLLLFNGIEQAGSPRTAAGLERMAALAEGPVADFGSGLGTVALFFSLMGLDVTSLEINSSLRQFQSWRFAKYGKSAPRFEPVSDHAYDLLLCTDVIEHLENPKAWVPFAARLLRPGGYLFLTHYFCKSDKKGGEYPMHLDDLDEVLAFFDQMERHFEPAPDQRNLDNSIAWRRRVELVEADGQFVAPSSEEEWRNASPFLPLGVALSCQRVAEDDLGYFVHKGDYFRKPERISKETYDYLHPSKERAFPSAEIRQTLTMLSRKKLVAWRRGRESQ